MRRTGRRRLISLGFYPLDYRGEFAYRGRRIKLAGFLIFRLWERFLILKTIVLEKQSGAACAANDKPSCVVAGFLQTRGRL
jgi:hypothetical protein